MKKGAILFLVFIVLAVGIYFLVFADSKVTDDSSQNLDYGNKNIEIRDFVYSPEILKVKIGEIVTWINYDSVEHTITSDVGNLLDSGLIGNMESYTMAFTEVGTYEYHCSPHPYMKGKIVVEK